MRGLALATLFLGLCFIEPRGEMPDVGMFLIFIRGLVFFVALMVIWFGA